MKRVVLIGSTAFYGRCLPTALEPIAAEEGWRVESSLPGSQDVYFANTDEAAQWLTKYRPQSLILADNSHYESGPEAMGYIDSAVSLFEALRTYSSLERLVLLSSGSIYAHRCEQKAPLDESSPLESVTFKDLALLTVDLMAYQYFKAYQLPVVRLRPFAIVNKNQQCFGGIEPQQLPNQADFISMQDFAEAVKLAFIRAKVGEAYNVCSGHLRDSRRVLDGFVKATSAVGAVEGQMWGSAAKFFTDTGWQSNLEQLD